MAKINNTWIAEFYAPVNSAKADEREEFYAYAAEAVEVMRRKDRKIPMILLGDFNGHIKHHYSQDTNENGELLLEIIKNYSLELINMNCPTFEQPGKNPTCVDYVALNKKGHEIVMTCKTRDEIYTTSNHHLIEITANSTLLNMTL